MRRRALLLPALAILAGCGSTERSSGGSSYETENALAVRILRPDGTPAPGVAVRARPLRWLEGESFDSSLDQRSDTDGRVRLDLPSGAWRLEAGQEGMLAVLDVPASGRTPDLGTLRLGRPASVLGRTVPGARIGVNGLHRSALADPSGFFHLDSLPAGVHVLHRIGSAERAFVQVEPGRSLDAGILRADSAGEIFLDDFEDGDARTWYGPWTGRGWWWVAADTIVHLSPDSVSRIPARAVIADGLGGKVFQFSADFPAEAPSTAWARCGLDFGPRPLDLSGLVSVRFRARGIGTLAVIVNIDSASWDEVPRAEVALDTTWQEFEIPASRLRLPASSGTTLDSAARTAKLRRAVGLTWSLSASGSLWLDNIRLIGPSPDLLWGPAPPP